MTKAYDLIIVGGGAAGIFAAIAAKECAPQASVAILEKSTVLLAKVRISGGGRCNVTHACFEPKALVENYPRGKKELLGPFSHFQPQDTINLFEKNGVKLKAEADGRVFPATNTSETIIDCLLEQARTKGVDLHLRQTIQAIDKTASGFTLQLQGKNPVTCRKLLLATGSSKLGYQWAQELGHTIQPPVPSLFTFNIAQHALSHLSGIAIDPVKIKIFGSPFAQKGSLLITHFGFSGPAILKLSAFAARFLHERGYSAEISINWLPDYSEESLFQLFQETKEKYPQKTIGGTKLFPFPRKLWHTFLDEIVEKRLVTIPDKRLHLLAQKLHADSHTIKGKTTHKEEFVTCGGVTLKEVDFKRMESKVCPGLFFAGEILDVDGITGGFNFQNAWTTGFIAGSSIF